jgi:predicted  nucleic acid-binding Zn-ribbon protein
MSTTQVVAALFQLQQQDLELDRLAAEHQAIVASLQGNAKLQRQRAEYVAAQQHLQAGLQAQHDAEWTLEDVNRRLKTQEQRLYSGTNPKELQSLQLEVQRLRAQQSRQEELTLEVIDAAESLKEVSEQKSAALKQAEEAWQIESAALVARRQQLETRKQELQGKREQLSTHIESDLLKRYDTMRRTKQGRAVSKVEQNSCQWCRVLLTPSELQRVRISAELQTCSNCGRILYYER